MRTSVALALLLVLPACTVAPGALPAAAPSPSAPPSVSPSPVASSTPTPTPPSTPSPTPTPDRPHIDGKTTIIAGTITDGDAVAVDGATVTVRSLQADVPFLATATSSQGSYVVNNLPEGLQVEVVATKPGWTSRRRVGAFRTQTDASNQVDFGGTAGGASFFLSSYPEIMAARPTDTGYAVTLSEPLDAANRARLEAALRLGPVESAGLTSGNAPADYQPDKVLPPAVAPNAFTWNAAGDQLQVTAAPSGGSYQLYLVAGPERIQDADGHPLGQDALQGWTAVPAGNLLRRAFYRSVATLPIAIDASPGQRWSITHFDAIFITP